MKKRGIIAMSGGVDSSVAATLLKKNGYDVVGVFLLMHNHSDPSDAKKVAKILNIPFYVLDAQKEFKKRVVDYLINEYKKGNTPNPCVECNKWIKFRFLLEKALQLKADYIATGHYVRLRRISRRLTRLLTAQDMSKDQSYFLWTLKQNQLKKILFPIGDYTKEQVRAMAKKFGLPVFEKKDSQEICFIPDADIRGFLKSRIHAERGPIVTIDGKKVGEHDGLVFYTIGQRKGIKIGGTGPYYVIKKDFKRNVLIVSKSQKDLLQKEMIVKNISWINKPPRIPCKCKVKIRSTAPMVSATIKKNKVIFDKLQRAITSGQSAVFYNQNEVLGGGIIV